MKPLRAVLFLLLPLAVLTGCKDAKRGGATLPNPAGAACDVLVVLSEESWKGELGEAYREALTEPYPYLPQIEPYFHVLHVSRDVFVAAAQKFRNLVITKIDPRLARPRLVIQADVYAMSQVVVAVEAPTVEVAASYVKENAERLRTIFDQTEKDRYAQVVKSKADAGLTVAVRDKFGFDIYFPAGYQLRTSKTNFIWISLETNLSSQGLLIFTSKYEGEADFTVENLCFVTDWYTKQHVPGPSDGSYMVTGKAVAPKVEKLIYKGRTWYRMRGFWDVKNDFMGGPFISYSTYWKEKNEVLTIRAYVYSPKKDKRKTLLQTETLIFNINIDGKKS
ncbi:DUF4837 family protein [uncultured Acetobacteroides sp.]|uniref:DUF4837 family protein n=1 Tax=uncultured Acetobacteroides sp. TaxID=1760811 RepID=UPI0029F49DFF|nr:DUF4837 family protein [uncultured Acetobacteroides sp.]